MHLSAPDVDWVTLDKQNREKNTDKIRIVRENLLNNNLLEDSYIEQISRDIEGEWNERGSNNLAGRIRTADIDFNNNII